MKKDRSILLYALLKRYLTWPLLGLWLISMSLLTWAVGKDFYNQLQSGADNWSSYHYQNKEYHLPGELRYELFSDLANSYLFLQTEPLIPLALPQVPSAYSSDDWIWGKWNVMYGFQAGFGFYDRSTLEPLFTSDRCYMLFEYSYGRGQEPAGWAYMDVDALPDAHQLRDRVSDSPTGSITVMISDMLLTGQLEGDQFYPQKIVSTSYPYSTYYEASQPVEDPVTVYTDLSIRGYKCDPGPGFFWDGVWYDDPAQLLRTNPEGKYGFFSSLIVVSSANDDYLACGVIHLSPCLYAMSRLWPVYLVTLLAVTVLLVILKKRLRQKLIEPFQVIDEAFRQNRTELSDYAHSPIWELQSLSGHFHAAQQERHRALNEVRQLQTALDYARDAEEKRRSMVSALAHELKTPLAVIHSYAEGLQEGIAPEKQAQYLSVIRQEARAMDELVLQMLELSRMDAGKVRLEPEQFSLTQLAAGILETMQPAAGERELLLHSPQDIAVTADKSKIRQAVTNLVSNAIKYAQGDGPVQIKIYRRSLSVYFVIENPCPPLSEEALSKVFDSFYRADTARDRSGTGLGLAIVKSIIALHRGQCKVRNTQNGVEFSFILPV